MSDEQVHARRLKILFNCTTNVAGGGVQNAANFIWYAVQDTRFQWLFAVSPQVATVLERWNVDAATVRIFSSPARKIGARRSLEEFATENGADLVYTMAGPAYVRFPVPHVLGISNPYLTHAPLEAFRMGRTLSEVVSALLGVAYRGWCARSEAQYWVFQTETSRQGFCRRFRVDRRFTWVVPNAVGKAFPFDSVDTLIETGIRGVANEEQLIFCPAADYPHKNLEIIPRVANVLATMESNQKLRFVLTLPPDSTTWCKVSREAKRLGVEEYVENIGPFSYADAFRLYADASAVFIPSILETFSTSYLEAIAAGRPLIVADRPFAREICGEAAFYFDPKSPISAATTIQHALRPTNKNDRFKEHRKQLLQRYGYYNRRYESLVRVLKAVADRVER